MTAHPVPSRAPAGIARLPAALGAAAAALTAWQWWALARLEGQGVRPACALGERLDCGAVWTSPLARWVHEATGLPFAGWGLVWGVALLALAHGRAAWRGAAAGGLRLLAAAGALGSLALLAYSLRLGTYCLSCLAFYGITWAAAWAAWRLPPPGIPARRGAAAAGGALALGLLAALGPALQAPAPDGLRSATQAPDLAGFLAAQPPEVRQLISDVLAAYRQAAGRPHRPDPQRLLFGPADAPVRLTDWIEIRCPHCRDLDAALRRIRELAPLGSWAEEGRHFPLDGSCNPHVPRRSDGASCLAARILICLGREDPAEADRAREALFGQQRLLDPERVWALAVPDPRRRREVEACVGSPRTGQALQEDIREAMAWGIEGTPLVVVNGRRALHYPPFLLALILAGGDPEHPAFQALPPPRPLPR